MKIIDLLNEIANGRAPKLIKYDNLIWKYEKQFGDYTDTEKYLFCDYMADKENIILFLNDEIEIIEKEKKIEKLDIALLGQCDNWLRCPTNKVTMQDIELNPYIIDNIRGNTLNFQRKINELIDEVNKLKGDKNE